MKNSVLLLLLGLILMPSCKNYRGQNTPNYPEGPVCITPALTQALTDFTVVGIGEDFLIIRPKTDSRQVGCMDLEGTMLLPVKEGNLFPVGGGLMIAGYPGKKSGVINLKGKTVIPFKYDTMIACGNYLIVKQNGKSGMLDRRGSVVISPEYDSIKPFYQEYGSKAKPAFDYEAAFYVEKDGDVRVVNLSRTDGSSPSKHEDTPYDYQRIERNGRYGYINYLGEEIPCQYDDASEYFSEGLAAVVKNGRFGFIDTQGNVSIPFQFEYRENAYHYYDILGYGEFSDGYASMMKGKKFGAIDRQGNSVIPYEYDEAFRFHNGVAAVMKIDGDAFKYGMIDKDNHLILPFDYEGIYFINDVLFVYKNGKYGVLSKEGKILLPFQYDFFFPFAPEGYIQVIKDNKYGLISDQGLEIIPCQYEYCDFDRISQLVKVKQNGKIGYLDLNNRVVIPIEFDAIGSFFNNGLCMVERDGKKGIHDLFSHCTLD